MRVKTYKNQITIYTQITTLFLYQYLPFALNQIPGLSDDLAI